MRVGYFINNEYTDPEMRENPPQQPEFDKVQRNILADKPRVTRFKINWDDSSTSGQNDFPVTMEAQAGMEENTEDIPSTSLSFTENTQNSMEVM